MAPDHLFFWKLSYSQKKKKKIKVVFVVLAKNRQNWSKREKSKKILPVKKWSKNERLPFFNFRPFFPVTQLAFF
jgi:hypothetical protein